jgi:EccD-like transmembrane domain
MRARLFRYTAQVVSALAAGLAALLLLGLGLCLNPPAGAVLHALAGDTADLDMRTLWLAAVVAVGAALTTAVGLIIPSKGITPFWGRFLEIFEGFVLLTLVPLTLAVFDVYARARAMTS